MEMQAYLADRVVEDKVHEVDPKAPRGLGRKGKSGSSKKVSFCGDGELVSSPPTFSGVITWD